MELRSAWSSRVMMRREALGVSGDGVMETEIPVGFCSGLAGSLGQGAEWMMGLGMNRRINI